MDPPPPVPPHFVPPDQVPPHPVPPPPVPPPPGSADHPFWAGMQTEHCIYKNQDGQIYKLGFFRDLFCSSKQFATYRHFVGEREVLKGKNIFELLSTIDHKFIARPNRYISTVDEFVIVYQPMRSDVRGWLSENHSFYDLKSWLPGGIKILIRSVFIGLEFLHIHGRGNVSLTMSDVRFGEDGKPKICFVDSSKDVIDENLWKSVVNFDYFKLFAFVDRFCGQNLKDDPRYKTFYNRLSNWNDASYNLKMLREHSFLMTVSEASHLVKNTHLKTNWGANAGRYVAATQAIDIIFWKNNVTNLYKGNTVKYHEYRDHMFSWKRYSNDQYKNSALSYLRYCRNFLTHIDQYIVDDDEESYDYVFRVFEEIWPDFLTSLKHQLILHGLDV